MKVTVLFRHIPTNSDAKDLINDRLASGLGRFSRFIDHVSVTLSDVNGPRGGLDQQCSLVVSVPGLSPIVIIEQQSEQGVAINRAVSRAKMALARQLKRSQSLKHARGHMRKGSLKHHQLIVGQEHEQEQEFDQQYDLTVSS